MSYPKDQNEIFYYTIHHSLFNPVLIRSKLKMKAPTSAPLTESNI